LYKLREGLDNAGLSDKSIGYTTRFNAFWDENSIPSGFSSYGTDGEGITINSYIEDNYGSSLNAVVDWVNIMMYDVAPSELGYANGFTLDTYIPVFEAYGNYIDKSKIVMGFEPGYQAAGGIWEGMNVDKEVVDYIEENSYGGIMFWAVNEPANLNGEITGQNCLEIADYAENLFTDNEVDPNDNGGNDDNDSEDNQNNNDDNNNNNSGTTN